MLTCVNHDKRIAAGRCAKCDLLFCDTCCAFLINGAAWCEPCGRAEREIGRGHKPLALVVLVVGLIGFYALMQLQLELLHGFFVRTLLLGLVPFAAAWAIAFPPTTGTRPTVIDRNVKRVALPPLKVDRYEQRRSAR